MGRSGSHCCCDATVRAVRAGSAGGVRGRGSHHCSSRIRWAGGACGTHAPSLMPLHAPCGGGGERRDSAATWGVSLTRCETPGTVFPCVSFPWHWWLFLSFCQPEVILCLHDTRGQKALGYVHVAAPAWALIQHQSWLPGWFPNRRILLHWQTQFITTLLPEAQRQRAKRD